MSKTMLVNVVNAEESRIAIVADGRLEELSIETAQQEQIEGNIYKARVVKAIGSLDAVFVDYGRERNGFLALPDIRPQYFRDEKRDVESLHKGQDLLVQVKKGELGQKGAALTTYVSLPGRHFVLMPHVSKRGVSRKIADEATREQLRKVLDGTGIPEEMGYIARTAAEGRTKQELTRDAGYLLRLWKSICDRFEEENTPALLYEETDIVIRTLRDYFTPAIREVLIDDESVYQQVQAFFQAIMPWHGKRLRLHQGKAPLFSKYNLEDQIASIYDKSVTLPSGGSIVIEQTEALVSIDVNSGKTTAGKDIEETALIANKEAAVEVARQLRLRDLGGLVVIDFIDMRPAKNRTAVRKLLQKELKEDKARTDTSTISKFGLLELSRQRIKGVSRAAAAQTCPVCAGLGRVRTPASSALSVLRRIQLRLPRKGAVRQVLVGVPPEVATLLQNRQRGQIVTLETRFDTEILVFAESSLAASQYYLEYHIKDRSEVETNLPESFNRARLSAPGGLPTLAHRPRRPTLFTLPEEEPAPDAPSPAGEDSDTPVGSPEPTEPTSETGKKRRRRRRKAKGGEEPAEAPEAPEGSTEIPTPNPPETPGERSAEPGSAAPEADRPETESEGEQDASSTPGGEEAKTPSASARRRQRRKRAAARTKNQDAGAPSGEQLPPIAPGTVQNGVADTQPEPDATEKEPERPKRPRRPRRRKPQEAEPEPTPGVDRGEEVAAEPADGPPADAPTAVPQPEPPVPEDTLATPSRPKPRARRGRKRATGTKPEETPIMGPVPSGTSSEQPAPATEEPLAAKPARRPRRKKPAATEAKAPQTTTTESDAGG